MTLHKKHFIPNINHHYFYSQRVEDFKLQVIKIHFADELSTQKFVGINLLNPCETINYPCLDSISEANSYYDAFCFLLSNLSEVHKIKLYFTVDVCEIFDFIKELQKETWDDKMLNKFRISNSGLEPQIRYRVILDSLLNDPEVQDYLKYNPLSKIINFVNAACYPEKF